MDHPKFYRCCRCGTIVEVIRDCGNSLCCCGEPMELLVPNSTDANPEVHIPVVSRQNGMLCVCVGAKPHPMIPEHYIQWVYVQTANGGLRRDLKPGEAPKAIFCPGHERVVAVYAYCNIHGLWMCQC